MQTKSVLTALSLALFCSSPAFSIGPRLAKVATLLTGVALGASPFVTHKIHNQREGDKLRGKVEKAKIEFDLEEWEAKELGMLSNDYLKELEGRKKKTIMEALYEDWQTKDSGHKQPRYRAARNRFGSSIETK